MKGQQNEKAKEQDIMSASAARESQGFDSVGKLE
jgi:hypothetical protein